MSTAILISGQLRTFRQCYPTMRWHVLRHFADPHFFVTVQDTPDCQGIDDLVRDYGADRVHADVRTDPKLEVTPEMSVAYDHAPYANAAPPHQLLLQHWYQNECWKAAYGDGDPHGLANAGLFGRMFDTVIRLRGDLWFHSLDDPFETNLRRESGLVRANECLTPWWGRFGGVNDRFAIMGPEAARHYFTVYDHIAELLAGGCPFHPESLVKAALERGRVELREILRTEFTTLRANGQHRPPEIMPWDIAHAALRVA